MGVPADVRWKQACTDYKNDALNLYDALLAPFPPSVLSDMESIAANYYENYVIEPYLSEINYFAQCTNLSTTQMTLVNLIYDFRAACTSIVAVDPTGRILHGRNQDFPNIFRNDTIDVIFINSSSNTNANNNKNNNKNNKNTSNNNIDNNNYTDFLYRGTTFFGYVGIPTGFKYNGFSITIDARDKGNPENNLDGMRLGYFASGWLVRQALMTCSDYDCAVKLLSETKIIAPIYYIIGGINYQTPVQGSVITRNFTNTIDIWKLSESEYGWYIVETNYDHWITGPDAPIDTRKEKAVKLLNEVGRDNINFNTLFGVLSTHPVMNTETVYTALMSASNDTYYNATIRFDSEI